MGVGAAAFKIGDDAQLAIIAARHCNIRLLAHPGMAAIRRHNELAVQNCAVCEFQPRTCGRPAQFGTTGTGKQRQIGLLLQGSP